MLPAYRKLAESMSGDLEKAIPIYVGKAVPPGSRKGAMGLVPLPAMSYISDCASMPILYRPLTISILPTFAAATCLWMIFGFHLGNRY